jgi:hypothetical protein
LLQENHGNEQVATGLVVHFAQILVAITAILISRPSAKIVALFSTHTTTAILLSNSPLGKRSWLNADQLCFKSSQGGNT